MLGRQSAAGTLLKSVALLVLLTLAIFGAQTTRAAVDAIKSELAPMGTLRVAIGVGPSPSAFYTMENGDNGHYLGVTVELATALADRLGVPVVFVPYPSSGEIIHSVNSGLWDLTFLPVDDERKLVVDFGNAYHLLQSTYLVSANSPITRVSEANISGVRIAGVKDTATIRASSRASPNATHIPLSGPDEAVALMQAGNADAIALGRESLMGISRRLPGTRILDGGFLNSTTAIAVPKGKPEALAYVSAFIEEAKSSGLLRNAFDKLGLQGAPIAPPGMKP